jgi:CDP-diacylglycerol--glycerol-3-phosphate 3-phosphatidyltransferase
MNVALWITSSRLVTALLFSFFFLAAVKPGLYSPDKLYLVVSMICVFLIELSDAIDGIVARKRNQVTPMGKIFDPICDSIARQTVICTFMVAGILPLWMFLIFLYRDAILNLIRIMCAINGTIVAAKNSGKLKAVFQAAGIIMVLVVMGFYTFGSGAFPQKIGGMHPGFWIMLFPAVFTILSLFDYLIPYSPIIRKMMTPENQRK